MSARVQVCVPSTSSVVALSTPARTQERGVIPICADFSILDLADTKATAGSHASSTEDETIVTARVQVTDTGSLYPTAEDDISVQTNKRSGGSSPADSNAGQAQHVTMVQRVLY